MSSSVHQGVPAETLRSISTPDQVDSRLGTLDFVDGVPSSKTSELVYDHLDFVHALNMFLNGFAGASTYALRKGFQEAGAKAARRYPGGQLDPDDRGQGLVPDPAPLQPAPVVLRQDLAA